VGGVKIVVVRYRGKEGKGDHRGWMTEKGERWKEDDASETAANDSK